MQTEKVPISLDSMFGYLQDCEVEEKLLDEGEVECVWVLKKHWLEGCISLEEVGEVVAYYIQLFGDVERKRIGAWQELVPQVLDDEQEWLPVKEHVQELN